ncbi:MAG: valine--tRNA ligase [Planctomycetota bacterium]
MSGELPKTYEPKGFESRITERWLGAGAFAAVPDQRPPERRYTIMMPLPNVTGALHMGHAMDNVMQDLLIRWHRMRGDNTLWQPGTDHAGIATQAVVEKRLKELEGKTRHDIGREALVARIWAWKDEYQARIVRQQQAMGCSCDWERQRFTMDAVCSAAVRETFFRLFRDKLIFRGDRLVNWDCHLQTAVANDEVYHETIQGHFWHLRYPFLDPQPGEPTHVVVATTRPETMLGDTAVATHPEPRRALEKRIAEATARYEQASGKERPEAAAELERLAQRLEQDVPRLEALVAMAKAGRTLKLPLLGREIPLILDEWAKPELGSGCVKITPAHDPNDYEVWRRHQDRIGILNVLRPDGALNDLAGPYAGQDRFAARKQVVKDLDALGLLDKVEDRAVEIGHSDRSKTPVEPYLSKQWFVRMEDVPGGVTFGRGTSKEFQAPGLAQAAIAAATGWTSATGRGVDFHPDGDRYRAQYVAWLGEKRDWCISRQLWWGHRIPVWSRGFESLAELATAAEQLESSEELHAWISDATGAQHDLAATLGPELAPFELQACLRDPAAEDRHRESLAELGLVQDPDVLDTWFSSALWPFSTLGWPDPGAAPIGAGQRALGGTGERESSLDFYYPGSCLVTGRDILTLWVARMVILGLYDLGDVPFTDVFLHCKILDGKGETMSKSRGNGVDPIDIIERYGADAMRYVICDMQTGSQDARLAVQADCPECGKMIELSEAKQGRTIFTRLCTHCGAELDLLGSFQDELPQASAYSDRFTEGQRFCNKLWNSARFALLNLGELEFSPLDPAALAPEDRWILSRLSRAIAAVDRQLAAYNPSAALGAAREFFWGDLCDWYLELIKPRMKEESGAAARAVLATVLDQVLRLFHPFVPFITEAIWEQLGQQAPVRGLSAPLPRSELCMLAAWPAPRPEWEDEALEADLTRVQEVLGKLRDIRSKYNVPPRKTLPGAVRTSGETLRSLDAMRAHLMNLGGLSALELGPDAARPKNAAAAVAGDAELFLGEVLDPEKERARLQSERDKLEKQRAATEKKLQNEKFVAKAPPEVVAAERARLAELAAQLEAIDQNLAAL